MSAELKLGRWQDVLADVECDLLCCDPPYGAAVHAAQIDAADRDLPDGIKRSALNYDCWTPEDVHEFVAHWSPRTTGWMACLTSDDLIHVFRAAYKAAGRLDFAPVPVLQHKPRVSCDGPGSGAVYLMVSRPREMRFMRWGSLPGWYMSLPARNIPRVPDQGLVIGGKPLDLMRTIICDYSRPGDVVCDPVCGGGSTLLAAKLEGRSAVGSECKPEHYEIALKVFGHIIMAPAAKAVALPPINDMFDDAEVIDLEFDRWL